MMTVDDILDELIRREGGYVDHPADRGGPTIWGITQAVARSAGWLRDLRTMPRDFARDVYRKRYWAGPGFDRVATLSMPIAVELLDTGVNMGPGVAVGFLQRALNALNRQGRDYADVRIDHAIGPATLAALAGYLKARPGAEGVQVFLRALNCLQGERYIALAEQRSPNEAFVYGWLRTRVDTRVEI